MAQQGRSGRAPRKRAGTVTSNFGVGRRESHDATAFYARFERPELSDDDEVADPKPVEEPFVNGDSRNMSTVESGTVALVVTSPPYFAGKQYEEELHRDGIPSSYAEYLDLLTDVFAECKRTLEPGGRIAVNVANLGRKPYRSLGADVVDILQNRLGLLLRGEVVWQKGEGASGNCAWGSFRSAANPVLRDTTERVVIASKGRFDRARSIAKRRAAGLPHRNTATADEFMAATLDVWVMAPESAKRVGHPAPFPVELPERLIHLYTFEDDLVLDPFLGSGTTMVAAARTNRRYVGYDTDPAYCAIAEERVADELLARPRAGAEDPSASPVKVAEALLEGTGFTVTGRDVKVRGTGVTLAFNAKDAAGRRWAFDVSGAFTVTPAGLARTDAAWQAVGRASVVSAHGHGPVIELTTHVPAKGTAARTALRSASSSTIFDVIGLTDERDAARLRSYSGGGHDEPLPGFW